MADHLTLAEVLAIHQAMIDGFGGASGLRDPGALEAALFRPQTGYYADVVEEAAALFESLVMNHPFVDGNKRVAFASLDVFLRMNEQHLVLEAQEGAAFVIGGLERGDLEFDGIVAWLRDHL